MRTAAAAVSISVLIVDDEALVRGGLRMILESQDDIEVIGEAEDGRAAVVMAADASPDVVLMDVRMPGLDGIEAARLISERPTPPRVIMLTTYDLELYIRDALDAGVSGFLLKTCPPSELVAAVRSCVDGALRLAPEIMRRLVADFVSRPHPDANGDRLAHLTDREKDVLVQIGRGLSNAEIAGRLFVAEATVRTHVGRIFSKLGLRDRAQAVVVAYESGLVMPGRPDAEGP